MNLISKLVGIVALIGMFIGLFPLLGWVNWIVIPLSIIGLFIGIFSKNRGGLNLNGIVLIVAIIRLFIGGGFI